MKCHVPGCRRKGVADIYDAERAQWIVCEPCYSFMLKFEGCDMASRIASAWPRDSLQAPRTRDLFLLRRKEPHRLIRPAHPPVPPGGSHSPT